MKWHHDPRLVRLSKFDKTLHCDVHGLLPEDETLDVLDRFYMDADEALARDERLPRWRRILGDAISRLSRPKCVPVQ